MRWLNPAALLGLVMLAVPILVHLFGRRVAKKQRFPSLRLLRDARPTPATRSRPSDLLLLVLRCAVVVAAVAGLAQPLWLTDGRRGAAQVPVRAILVDTSASVARLTSDGVSGVERSRALGRTLLDSAREGIVVETSRPGSNVAGAALWLANRSGLRELVIVSDFRLGGLSDGNLQAVPDGIGIRLVRAGTGEATRADSVSGGVRVAVTPDQTAATWTMADSGLSLTVLAAAEDRDAVRASTEAVRELVPRASNARGAVLVFPGAQDAPAPARDGLALDSAWHGDFLLSLRQSELLAAFAPKARAVPGCAVGGVSVARNSSGETVATIARAPNGATYGLVIRACVGPGTAAGASLIAAVESALDTVRSPDTLEPTVLPDETLRRWERPATESAPRGEERTSPDGRWFWLLALVLLAVEEWLRRRSPRTHAPAAVEVPRERVA